jgi:hypothetical protein
MFVTLASTAACCNNQMLHRIWSTPESDVMAIRSPACATQQQQWWRWRCIIVLTLAVHTRTALQVAL